MRQAPMPPLWRTRSARAATANATLLLPAFPDYVPAHEIAHISMASLRDYQDMSDEAPQFKTEKAAEAFAHFRRILSMAFPLANSSTSLSR